MGGGSRHISTWSIVDGEDARADHGASVPSAAGGGDDNYNCQVLDNDWGNDSNAEFNPRTRPNRGTKTSGEVQENYFPDFASCLDNLNDPISDEYDDEYSRKSSNADDPEWEEENNDSTEGGECLMRDEALNKEEK